MNSLPKFEKSFCKFLISVLRECSACLHFIDKEAPTVASRTSAEIEAFRLEKQMRVQGRDVPKPVVDFDEAGFPSKL